MKNDTKEDKKQQPEEEKAEEPAKTEKPATAEEPAEATTKAEKPEKAEEPAKAEKPEKAEEPAKAEKSATAEETAKTEKPAKAEKTATTEKAKKKDKKDKKSHKLRYFLIAVAVLAISGLLLLYLGGAYYYKEHFFPYSRINGVECGRLTAQEAEEALRQWYTQDYSLQIVDEHGTELLVVIPADCEMTFLADEEITGLLEAQNEYAWIKAVWEKLPVENQISVETAYNKEALEKNLGKTELFTHKGEAPQDAYISDYEEEAGCYRIVAEKEGTLLDEEKTLACIEEALGSMQRNLNLREADCYVRPKIDSQNEELVSRLEELNRIVGTRIVYDWNGNEEILDGTIIHTWLTVEDGEILLDEEQLAAYVEEKAKAYDTYGKKRKFTTTLGVELTLPGGTYGWRTDREAETEALKELIWSGAVTEREPEYRNRGWVKGSDDIGNSYVEIDLTDQHLYLYQDGEIVLESDIVSGKVSNGNTTPAGIFGLSYKTKDAVLRGETYESHVHYWMPFNGNIGMHDATWRKTFGGDIYLTNGSHGCVNLPLSQAKAIYGYVSEGFPIICYYY